MGYQADKKVEEIIEKNSLYIKAEILAEEIKRDILTDKDIERKITVNNWEILVSLKRK
jgi:hypothetical protein